jgi:hypothetical protein
VEAAGQIYKAQDFDGTDDYVNCGAGASVNIIGDLTLEAWMNIRDYTIKNAVFNTGVDGAYLFDIYASSTPNNRVIFWHNSTPILDTSNKLQSINTWQHIVAVRNHTTDKKVRLYVNGELAATSNAYTTNPASATQNLWIGRYDIEYLDGLIDEARISNVARSAAWIKASYHAGAGSLLKSFINETITGNFLMFF